MKYSGGVKKRDASGIPSDATVGGKAMGMQSMKPTYGSGSTQAGEHARGGSLAKVKGASSAASGGIPNPVRKPNSGLNNKRVGQAVPDTSAAATKKPSRKGLAAFYGVS
jgi:hypothetical protein